jgi:hypothetical protein
MEPDNDRFIHGCVNIFFYGAIVVLSLIAVGFVFWLLL